METNNKQGNAEEILTKITAESDAEPVKEGEGFHPSAAEIGPEMPCSTYVPTH